MNFEKSLFSNICGCTKHKKRNRLVLKTNYTQKYNEEHGKRKVSKKNTKETMHWKEKYEKKLVVRKKQLFHIKES